ncbi:MULTISPECIES: Bax inhibitor-1/YccA family protein [Actinomyces]|uniref:Bax inhibitor-1/YccA family protein n=1 Tax=Actinomyces TaxID=1654 RepID=UPI00096A66AF|nr:MULTISPECIES: Bax inhibitor-1/YccA family protein [Actinomyces]
MANPVFNRLESEWKETTPAGYPTMPGYQPGSADTADSTRFPYAAAGAAQASQRQVPTYDQHALDEAERAYAGASADAVDRGRMTYDDVIMKTGLLFGVLLVGAVLAWMATVANPGLGVLLMGAGMLVGFVLAMVNIFSKTIRPALIMAYAAAQGLAMGGLSAIMEAQYDGIVGQAVLATAAVFAVTLALFASGRVRNSPKLARFTLIALIGILVYRVLNWILVLTGVFSTAGGMNDATFMGFQLGTVVGVVAVLIGAACLIQDFDQAKVGVEMGAPAKFAWSCAFGLMVTVVWMYVEILQLLGRMRN